MTGPTFILAMARKPLSSVFSSSSQPGMQAFSTSGSLSLAQTASRGAASWTSPFIVMAIVMSLLDLHSSPCAAPSKARRGLKRKAGASDAMSDAQSHKAAMSDVRVRGLAAAAGEWLGRAQL